LYSESLTMKYQNSIIITLCFSLALIQISCRDNNTPKKKNIVLSNPAVFDSFYQKRELINGDQQRVRSIIHFSERHNSPMHWQYKAIANGLTLEDAAVLSNGEIVNVLEEYNNKTQKNGLIVIIVDKNGKEIYREEITDALANCNIKKSWIVDCYGEGFALYIRKKTDIAATVAFNLSKIVFKKTNTGYTSQNISMNDGLRIPLQERGFSLVKNNAIWFDIYSIQDKIFLSSNVKNKKQIEFPFIAIFDKNFKLVKMNVFEELKNTCFNGFFFNTKNTFYIRGAEKITINVYNSLILKRFIINEDLKIIKNYSDISSPYYDRVDSQPTPRQEKVINTFLTKRSKVKVETAISKKEYITDDSLVMNTFYRDIFEDCYYTKPRFDYSDKIIFNKVRRRDGANLWEVNINLPKNYKMTNKYSELMWYETESMKGLNCNNGNFALITILEVDDKKKKLYNVMSIFVFDKKGNLVRQFVIPNASEIKGVNIANQKLIVSYISDEDIFLNKMWKGSSYFYVRAYSLD